MSLPTNDHYFRRFLAYALDYRGLLAIAVLMGVLKFGMNYTFPWLIGSAIDTIAPRVDITEQNEQIRTQLRTLEAELAQPPGEQDPQQIRQLLQPPPALETRSRAERIEWLWVLIGLGIVFSILHSIATFGRGFYAAKLGNRIIADIRQDLFDHLHRLSLHFYSKERTGSIVSRLITDIQQASQIVNGGFVAVVMDLFSMTLGLALLFSLSWRLTLATMVIFPLYAITYKKLNPRVKAASQRVQSQISKISGNVQERLAGIALVKTSAAEKRESDQFREDTEEHYDRVVEQSGLSQRISAISEGLVHIGQTTVIGLGGYLALGGSMSPGDVVKFMGWLSVMYLPVRRFAEVNVVYQTSLAAIERVFQVFDITPKIVEKPDAIKESPQLGEVIFENVCFDYTDDSDESRISLEEHSPMAQIKALEEHRAADDSEYRPALPRRWTLRDLSFHVKAGERIALVGPSGSGKSTMVSLLPRLYDVTCGRILIDGHDLRDYKHRALRKAIGIVQQDSFLFTGTIRENIAYGRPKATEKEMIAASTAANAHQFISELPEGYDTLLGERGVNLSGGQRQRISIARAILKNPRILILDEATSALDSESERLVQQALEQLMNDRTCFIIAHRLSTVRNVDRILVMKDGQICEHGTHDELCARGGLYARLLRHQLTPAPTAA